MFSCGTSIKNGNIGEENGAKVSVSIHVIYRGGGGICGVHVRKAPSCRTHNHL